MRSRFLPPSFNPSAEIGMITPPFPSNQLLLANFFLLPETLAVIRGWVNSWQEKPLDV